MIVAAEVEDAVDDGLGDVVAALGADDDVAELARARGRAGFVEGERENVGGLVEAAVLAVELRILLEPTSSTARCPSSTPAAVSAAPTASRRSLGTSPRSMPPACPARARSRSSLPAISLTLPRRGGGLLPCAS